MGVSVARSSRVLRESLSCVGYVTYAKGAATGELFANDGLIYNGFSRVVRCER